MKTIIVRNQAEFDALPDSFKTWTEIEIRSTTRVIVNRARENSTVTARGNSTVTARGNSTVTARENSTVTAWENSTVTARENSTVTARENSTVTARGNSTVTARGNSTVTAWENSTVTARGNSTVTAWENSTVTARENSTVTARGNSTVTAWENSTVTAWENSTVTARENSTVTARGNSTVTARENSTVTARENSTVTAWENSTVTAWENSTVTARGNSTVTAWENSTVTAWGNVCIHIESDFVTAFLFGFAVAFTLAKAKIVKKSKTCTVITPATFKTAPTLETYEGHYPLERKAKKVILYKAVRKEGEGLYASDYDRDFKYRLGETVKHTIDKQNDFSCSRGLHVSHLEWARNFGTGWNDLAIIECEVPVSKIIVAKDCDGKVRTSELTVIREVTI